MLVFPLFLKGLFHRSILMSGSAMSDWATTNHSAQITMQISEGVGCSFDDDFLSCMRKKRLVFALDFNAYFFCF